MGVYWGCMARRITFGNSLVPNEQNLLLLMQAICPPEYYATGDVFWSADLLADAVRIKTTSMLDHLNAAHAKGLVRVRRGADQNDFPASAWGLTVKARRLLQDATWLTRTILRVHRDLPTRVLQEGYKIYIHALRVEVTYRISTLPYPIKGCPLRSFDVTLLHQLQPSLYTALYGNPGRCNDENNRVLLASVEAAP